MTLPNPILMATIGAPHGIKGEVRVKTFGSDPMALGDYGKLHTKDGRTFKITRMRPQKTVVVVKFKGVNTREEAQALNGINLFIDRANLPDDIKEDEFYVTDLIGCDVLNDEGSKIGTIVAVPNFGAGDLVEIAPLMDTGGMGTQTWYLEFTRENVPLVDLENHAVTVKQPDEVSERDAE